MADVAVSSPIRRILLENSPLYYPFGNTESKDVLEGFNSVSPTNILFLGCGDVRNVLHTILHSKTPLNVHINDVSGSIVARGILVIHIIKQPDFNPNEPEDLRFLWDVWYNLEWSHVTRRKFTKAVEHLISTDFNEDLKMSANDVDQIKKIWISWIGTASRMTTAQMEKIKKERLKVSTEFFAAKMKREWPSAPEMESHDIFDYLIEQFLMRIGTKEFSNKLTLQVSVEIKSFFRTGNCELIRGDKVCINPTLLEPDTEEWKVHYMSCPYEGYLPLPVSKLDSSAPNGVILQYCQLVLKNLVIGYKQHEKKVLFHFHLGDALQLCYRHPKQYNIIDTSNLPDHVGLANILNAARCALIDDPSSILRTESMTWPTLASTLLEYVETALCSPVSLFPALYGFRLLNSVALGNSKPFNIDRLAVSTVLLKWQLAPNYEDVKFQVSTDLQACLSSLKKRCFFLVETDPTPNDHAAMKSYTPLTYCNVLGCLIQRCSLSESDVKLLLSPEMLPVFSLTWRAFHDWMIGRPVFHVKATIPGNLVSPGIQLSKLLGAPALRVVLVPNEDFFRFMTTSMNLPQQHPSPHTFIDNVYYIDNLEFQPNMNRRGDVESLTVSFYLPKNHGLESTHQVFVADLLTNIPICCIGSFQNFFCFEILKDRPQFDILNRQVSSAADVSILKLDHCLEFAFHYEVQVSILGNKCPSGLKVLIDRTATCDSGHRVTLSLSSPKTLKPLVLTLPWPVTDDLKATLHKSQRLIQLNIKKAIYEPWPFDFAFSSKWAVDSMERWNKCHTGNQSSDLGGHLMMQFLFCEMNSYEKMSQGEAAISTPLNELRETIRSLFVNSTVHGRTLFAVSNKNHPNPNSPDWFLRVHLPLRVSPEGSPLLRVTAVDHRRTEKLTATGELDKKQAKEDFLKIFQADGEVTSIVTYTDEEARLLRYMLRMNSTRVKPNSWETKYLSKNQNGSWIPTYVCPLYVDHPGNFDDMLKLNPSASPLPTNSPKKDCDDMCSRCRSKDGPLKRCARCKKAKYCSVQCQRADWSQHKMICSA